VRRRTLAWGLGLAAAAAYLLAASLTLGPGRMPVRPLFDGTQPAEPYNWVNPPPDAAATNADPTPGESLIPLTKTGSVAASVGTDDGQATISLGAGAFPPKPKQTEVRVHVAPLDPATLGVTPPSGLEFAGNAYEFTGTYEPGKIVARELDADVSIVLRYPVAGKAILRLDGTRWTTLPSEDIVPSLLLTAPTDRLGVYVAAATPQQAAPAPTSHILRRVLTAVGAVIVGGILALIARRRARRRVAAAAAAAAARKKTPRDKPSPQKKRTRSRKRR
jgi:hypothetical protein